MKSTYVQDLLNRFKNTQNQSVIPPMEDEEESVAPGLEAVSPLINEIEAQRAVATPTPDFANNPMIQREMSNAQELEKEVADLKNEVDEEPINAAIMDKAIAQSGPVVGRDQDFQAEDRAGGTTDLSRQYLEMQQMDRAGGTTPMSQDYLNMNESVSRTPANMMQELSDSQPLARLQQYRDLLNQAQKGRRDNLLTANLLMGGNQIAQGFATQSGARIGAGEDAVRALRDQAGMPVQEISEMQKNEATALELGNEMEMNDPNSDISRFAREQARGLGKQLGMSEEAIAGLDKMSAKQLEKLRLFNPFLMGRRSQGFTTLQGFVSSEGLPLFRNNSDGSVIDASGKPVDLSKNKPIYLYEKMGKGSLGENFIFNPITGSRVIGSETGVNLSPSGKIQTFESKAKDLDNLYKEKGLGAFPNLKTPEVRNQIQKEQTELSGLTKNYTEQNTAASKLEETLKTNNKLTGAVVKTQMPRLSGEVGNLNQTEQEIWQGSQAALDRLNQYLETLTDSQLTPDNKKQINELLKIYKKSAQNAYNNILERRANSLGVTYDVPPTYFKELFGTPFQTNKSKPSYLKAGEIAGKTADGRIAIFDEKTKKFLRYQDGK